MRSKLGNKSFERELAHSPRGAARKEGGFGEVKRRQIEAPDFGLT